MATAKVPAKRSTPRPTPLVAWMAMQVYNLDDQRRLAALEIQARWGFDPNFYSHARIIRILSRENSEHTTGAKLLADDYITQYDLTPDKMRSITGIPGAWYPSEVDYCTYTFTTTGKGCAREAIPGTGLCGRHGGQWMSDEDRQHLSHEISDKLSKLASKAVRVIEDLLDNGRSEKVRLDAAMAVLDRTGMGPTSTLKVRTEGPDASEILAERLDQLQLTAAQVTESSTTIDTDEILDAEVVEDADLPSTD